MQIEDVVEVGGDVEFVLLARIHDGLFGHSGKNKTFSGFLNSPGSTYFLGPKDDSSALSRTIFEVKFCL